MITIEKQTNSIKFTFSGNSWYLQDGTIEVPMNSLMLVTDSSNMATFKKSSTNDIFISATYDELGMTKTQLEDWFKANACSANGGSAVKEMYLGTNYDTVDAETGVVTKYQVGDTVSGHTIVEEDFHYLIYVYVNDDEEYSLVKVDMDNYITENEFASGTTVVNHVVRGVVDPNSEQYLTVGADGFKVSGIDAALNEKADVSAFTAHTADTTIHLTSGDVENQIDAAISGKVDTDTYTAYTAATDAALSGKQDTLSAGTNITISGNVISADANNVVNVTQAEYDALVTGGTVDPTVLYNITDATPIDMSQYWTSAETESAITQATSGKVDTSTFETYSGSVETALSGKQDTLSAGTNITISGNVISAEGGGKAIEAGRGITVTTSETADTVSLGFPIWSGGSFNSNVKVNSENNDINYGSYSFALGSWTKVGNKSEFASGSYNVSNKANKPFGDSGNTLFSVGNGTSIYARHNAFEIRQNGDIYISKDGTDIKLQDALGGEVSSAITSGDTNPVQGGVLYDELRVGTPTQEVVLEWEQSDGGESTNYPSGCTKLTVEVDENEMTSGVYTLQNDNYDCFGIFQIDSNNGVITVTTSDCESNPSTSITYSISGNVVTIEYPTITGVTIIGTSYDNYWTFKAIIEGDEKSLKEYTYDKFDEVEQVTAAALNTLSENFDGLKLKKVSQAQYDALISGGTVDNNTLYVVI